MIKPGQPFWRLRLLIIILVIVLIGVTVAGLINPDLVGRIRTVNARFGRLEKGVVGQAVILRFDELIPAPEDGNVTLLTSPGREVRVGDLLAEIDLRTVGSGGDLFRDGIALSSAMYEEERERLVRGEQDIMTRLADAERVMGDALTTGDPDIIEEARARRDQFRNELVRIQSLMTQLERQWEDRQAAIESGLHTGASDPTVNLLRAHMSGTFFASFDGLERTYLPGRILNNFPMDIEARPTSVTDGDRVITGQPLVRISRLDDLEVVVKLQDLPIGSNTRVNLQFPFIPDRLIEATVTELRQEDEAVLLRLRVRSLDPAFYHQRHTQVTILPDNLPGIIVPTSAITLRDDRYGVYMMLGEQPIFRQVKVIGGNRDEAIIETMNGVPVDAPIVANPRVLEKRLR